MDDRGRVVLPAELRHQLGLAPGDELFAEVDGAGLRLIPRRGPA
ncbi:MAG: AbrB/MazE/SpoVT family DNA-binding domain-containing protein [Pseudonocardia sp.]|nr:AbrB/MazE/SpoVT family DNA-binding domain-containing protein [Pseudonocardia sp.]